MTSQRITNNRSYRQWLVDEPQRAVRQAAAEGRVERGECNDWRMDALERAGELALAGEYQASRKMAEEAR